MTGSELADASVWLMATMTLAVFDITKVDEGSTMATPDISVFSVGVLYVCH